MKKTLKTGLTALLAAATISGCATIDKYNPSSIRNKYESLPKIIIYLENGDNLRKEATKYVNMNEYNFDKDMLPAIIDINSKYKRGKNAENFMLLPHDPIYCKEKQLNSKK